MDNNEDKNKICEQLSKPKDELANVELLKRTLTNTTNALKRTFTVSSKSTKLFSDVFQYDESVVINDGPEFPKSNGCNISRKPTKQELDSINMDLEWIIN